MLGDGKSKGHRELGKELRVLLYLGWCINEDKLGYVAGTNSP